MDIWAVGCIFAELFLRKPLFVGNGYEVEQIFKIFEVLGTPSVSEWENLPNLPDWKLTFPKWNPQPLNQVVPTMPQLGLDLLARMLELNPEKRITAWSALEHPYFNEVGEMF